MSHRKPSFAKVGWNIKKYLCILDDDDAYDHDNDDDDDHNWMKWRSRSPGGSGRVWSMAAWLTNGWFTRQKLSLPRISYSDQLELISTVQTKFPTQILSIQFLLKRRSGTSSFTSLDVLDVVTFITSGGDLLKNRSRANTSNSRLGKPPYTNIAVFFNIVQKAFAPPPHVLNMYVANF